MDNSSVSGAQGTSIRLQAWLRSYLRCKRKITTHALAGSIQFLARLDLGASFPAGSLLGAPLLLQSFSSWQLQYGMLLLQSQQGTESESPSKMGGITSSKVITHSESCMACHLCQTLPSQKSQILIILKGESLSLDRNTRRQESRGPPWNLSASNY